MATGLEFRENMANKENESFFVYVKAIKRLSSKYIPENIDRMTKWAINTFSAWIDVRSKKIAAHKGPLNIFEKCEA